MRAYGCGHYEHDHYRGDDVIEVGKPVAALCPACAQTRSDSTPSDSTEAPAAADVSESR